MAEPVKLDKRNAPPKAFLLSLVCALLLILVDQGTKVAIVTHFQYGEVRSVTSFFNLCYVRNTGAAFSFLSDAGGWQQWFFIALSVCISAGIIYFLMKNARADGMTVGFVLLLAGALGNFIDRVASGSVVDFLDFFVGSYHWPAFNVADTYICVGVALLLFLEFTKKEKPDIVKGKEEI